MTKKVSAAAGAASSSASSATAAARIEVIAIVGLGRPPGVVLLSAMRPRRRRRLGGPNGSLAWAVCDAD